MRINPHIRDELKLFLKEHVGKLKEKIIVTSPQVLNSEDKELILTKVLKFPHYANLEYKIEPNLLAGAVIRIGSKIIDLSLRGQLMNVQRKLYETT